MSVIVKTVHAAIAEGKDPKVEIRQSVMNYPSTGKSSSELIMGRLLKTKIPTITKPPNYRVYREAKSHDKMTREKRKQHRDSKKRAVTKKNQTRRQNSYPAAEDDGYTTLRPFPLYCNQRQEHSSHIIQRRPTKTREVLREVLREQPHHLTTRQYGRE